MEYKCYHGLAKWTKTIEIGWKWSNSYIREGSGSGF